MSNSPKALMVIVIHKTGMIMLKKLDHKPRQTSLSEVKDFVLAALLQEDKLVNVVHESDSDIIQIFYERDVTEYVKQRMTTE